jgi:hypothetical protein
MIETRAIETDDGKWVRDRLARNGVPQAAIEKHLV